MRYSIVHRMVEAVVSDPATMANKASLMQAPIGSPLRTNAPYTVSSRSSAR